LFQDYLQLALGSLINRKLRSFLTILGIVIGVAAIISLISISQGMENAIVAQFERIGSNKLFVTPKTMGSPTSASGLTVDDVKALEGMSDFTWVTPYLYNPAVVKFGNQELYLSNIAGIPADNLEKRWKDFDFTLAEGRYLTPQDTHSVIIGAKVYDGLFDRKVRINNNLVINNTKFKVVGILDTFGNPDDDSVIWMDMGAVRSLFNEDKRVTLIDLAVKSNVDNSQVAKRATRVLERKRGNDNFEVTTPDQILEQLQSILSVLQVVLVGIAAISIVVGAIGIMNTTYTSVLERTNEIGVMKAIGAQNKDIMIIFLIESGITGLVGGIMGVLFGAGIAFAAQKVINATGYDLMKVIIRPELVVFGLVFALGVGMLSGVLPARSAAQLKPVKALQYD